MDSVLRWSGRGLGAVATTLAFAACGGASHPRAAAPSGRLTVEISAARFPAAQRLARKTRLVLAIRNPGPRAIPDVAVTICNVTCAYNAPSGEGVSAQPFAQDINIPNLESRSRPVWIVTRPPGPCRATCPAGGSGAGVTSYANTWALGALKPGATASFAWALTPVAAGRHVVAWEVAGDLDGRPPTVLPDGSPAAGSFRVTIAQAPAPSYVTASGRIVTVR